MIVNKEALDKLSVEISTTFLECENPCVFSKSDQ